MENKKSMWNSFFKYFSKSEKIKNPKLHHKIKSLNQITEDDEMFDAEDGTKNYRNPRKLKRHQTCSIDLSDKTYRLRNLQELSNIESSNPLPRSNSINLNIDFPKKMLSITDFEEHEVLGQGAFGRAIKVKYLKTGAFFVMKEVVSHSIENEESLIREVSLLRSLKHNNILTCLGLVLKDKRICLLTELMHGGSLQAKIQDLEQPISLDQKILFLKDIASGMSFLHQNSIMHRDLTSSNCLLRRNNTVVVSDFGLSKFLYSDSDNSKLSLLRVPKMERCSSSETINGTNNDRVLSDSDLNRKKRNFLSFENVSQVGMEGDSSMDDSSFRFNNMEKRKSMNLRRKHTVVGNPFWMAPEMLAGKTYNCLVDLYSFGIIGCEITARISAHPDTLERHNKDMSVNISDFIEKNKCKELENCPEELITVIKECCKADPDLRPTFDTILMWLEDILFRVTNNLQLRPSWSNT